MGGKAGGRDVGIVEAGAGMITMVLPYPPSSNRYWRTYRGRTVKSDEARKYQDEAGWCARVAGAEMLAGDVAMELKIYRPRKSGDTSNRIKVLEDAMQGILYENDNQIVEIHAYRFDDSHSPRIELKVWEANHD
jgi:crossover junction endodeoxyribonuclease RusA